MDLRGDVDLRRAVGRRVRAVARCRSATRRTGAASVGATATLRARRACATRPAGRRACRRGAPSPRPAGPARRRPRRRRRRRRRGPGHPRACPPAPASRAGAAPPARRRRRPTHTAVSACSQSERASVPVPSRAAPRRASTAYAAQCTARQARRPRRARSRLVTIEGEQQVEGQCAEAEPQRAVVRREGDDGVERAQMREGVEHRGEDVRGEQHHDQQRDVAVQAVDHEARRAHARAPAQRPG